ncbi:hypothetical protein FHG87_022782 [Trinorchestia longiramus]|nr:hypothetical protein FHG87_022782 [Trinorchestia longiramus]
MLERASIFTECRSMCEENRIFQHDNASVHNARHSKQFFDVNNIQLLNHPPCSPDLNPIENLWGWMAKEVYKTYYNLRPKRVFACPGGTQDFRKQQCERFNKTPFNDRTYQWEPYYECREPLEFVSIQVVSESVADRPTTSTRKRSTQLTMSRKSLQRILKEDLKYHPYKIPLTQELQLTDYQKRLDFAQNVLQLADDENFITNLIMTDEAHFHLNGEVNKQNCSIWASENPREIHEHPLHPLQVTVWCGITSSRIIDSYFFEDVDGNTVTVNGNRYRQMLQEYFS